MTAALRPDDPIGLAARRHPELLAVFDRFGLDYCCHGRRTVDEACRAASADTAAVLASADAAMALPAATRPDRDWAAMSMAELCDDIERTHHVFARDTLSRAEALADKIAEAHGNAHPGFIEVRAVVRELRNEMLDHMIREERVLFPWLRRLERHESLHVGPPWSVKRPIDCMVHDHESVAAAFERLRRLTADYTPPPGTCGSVAVLMNTLRDLERDTRTHIHKENNILFPAGVRAEAVRNAAPAPAGPTIAAPRHPGAAHGAGA
ncbi:MAG: DUF542 domain-containing protein [Phycisphaerae bacterium]|nr:DUF542 domain-containing protein [Phycisphaerae bacterium]